MNFEIQTSSYFDAEAKLLLYDKADASSIKMNVVRQIIKDLGLDLLALQNEGKLKSTEVT
jgi:hypothetical protein